MASFPLQAHGHVATASGLAGASVSLSDIVSTPSGRLYAVGGPGLAIASATNESATSWQVASYSQFADTLRGVAFIDAERGFAVGDDGRILRTLDKGAHWEAFNRTFESYDDPQWADLRFDGAAYAVAFADAEHGVIVGEDRILRSSDGGQQWQRVPQSLDHIALQRLQFVDARRGWAVGSSGTVLRTDDSGAHWVTVSLGDEVVHLMGVSFSDPTHGCIGGGYKVWCSADAGQHWQRAEVSLPKGIDGDSSLAMTQLLMRDASQGWFVTRDGLIFDTSDGGRHWRLWMDVIASAQGQLTGVELWGLALGRDRAWAVGAGGFVVPGHASQDSREVSLDSSPLIVSWPLH